MRGLSCSAEFMRRFERLARQTGWQPGQGKRGLKRHTVEALSHHFCIGAKQIYDLLRAVELRPHLVRVNPKIEAVHPSLLREASRAGAAAPKIVEQALSEGWTTGRVRQEVRRIKCSQAGPLPKGIYDVVYADPPWHYSNTGVEGAAARHYPTMPTETIKALAVRNRVAGDATLFLWVTNPFLREGLEVAEAWGFTYRTNMVWVKRNALERGRGVGFYVRGYHELMFICTRGSHVPTVAAPASVIEAEATEHSRKPDAAYRLIEQLYPRAQRLELFARGQARPGWTTWGDEAA